MEFNKKNLIKMLRGYLKSEIHAGELVIFAHSYLDKDNSKLEDELLSRIYSSIILLGEEDVRYRTPIEELQYLYNCLIGKEKFLQDRIDEISQEYYEKLRKSGKSKLKD